MKLVWVKWERQTTMTTSASKHCNNRHLFVYRSIVAKFLIKISKNLLVGRLPVSTSVNKQRSQQSTSPASFEAADRRLHERVSTLNM